MIRRWRSLDSNFARQVSSPAFSHNLDPKRTFEDCSKFEKGIVDLVRKDDFPAGSKVLYAHMGGVPAINGYSYIYRNG